MLPRVVIGGSGEVELLQEVEKNVRVEAERKMKTIRKKKIAFFITGLYPPAAQSGI